MRRRISAKPARNEKPVRSFLFNIGFWLLSGFYVVMCAVLSLLPGRGAVQWGVRRYVKRMVQLMRLIGIRPEARGRHNLPQGPFIIAAKHTSIAFPRLASGRQGMIPGSTGRVPSQAVSGGRWETE